MAEFIQKHNLFSFYSGLMIIIVFIAIFAPWLAPGDAFTSNISQALNGIEGAVNVMLNNRQRRYHHRLAHQANEG